MPKPTSQELDAAAALGRAIVNFFIACEAGYRSRTPEVAPPQVKVTLPDMPPPTVVAEKPEPSPPSDDPGQMIGVDKVAELLECSSRTVYRLADVGLMPRPKKLGAMVRWPLREIRQWVEEGCPRQRRRPRT